jgi:hypothetical protein
LREIIQNISILVSTQCIQESALEGTKSRVMLFAFRERVYEVPYLGNLIKLPGEVLCPNKGCNALGDT